MKKTFKQLLEIDEVVTELYKKTPELKDTKFGYAYKRFFEKNTNPLFKKFKENMADLSVEHALESKETKEILTDDKGNYKYSKEGKMALTKAQRKFNDEIESEEIEIEPYISPYIPALTDEQFEALEGTLVESVESKKKNAKKDTEKSSD